MGNPIKRFLKEEWEEQCYNMFGYDWKNNPDYYMYFVTFNKTIDKAFQQ